MGFGRIKYPEKGNRRHSESPVKMAGQEKGEITALSGLGGGSVGGIIGAKRIICE